VRAQCAPDSQTALLFARGSFAALDAREPLVMVQSLEERIRSVATYDDYLALFRSLAELDHSLLFRSLWHLAIRERWDGRRAIASFLLANIDPPPARGCEELVLELASASWDLSNKVLPFYLVTQFGKTQLLSTIEQLVGRSTDSTQKVKLEGVAYWAKMPAANLAEPLHYFSWEEAIEGNAHGA
jgi:hypothetical protein